MLALHEMEKKAAQSAVAEKWQQPILGLMDLIVPRTLDNPSCILHDFFG
jgi:hypothetical protein